MPLKKPSPKRPPCARRKRPSRVKSRIAPCRVATDPEHDELLRASGRACHDCGRLTYDHRCPDCLVRWRIRHHVAEDELGEQEWWAL